MRAGQPARSKRNLPRDAESGSTAQPVSKHQKANSAAQPASVPQPVPDAVCFVTYMEATQRLNLPEPKLDMLLALQTAAATNPAVIVVCLQHARANTKVTQQWMKEWARELELLHSQGKAKRVVRQSCVVGVIRFDFKPPMHMQEIDPEGGFPAMLLRVGSLSVVAASWPNMPMRACIRVMSAYIREAKCEAKNNAAQPVAVVVGGNLNMTHQLPLGHLATQCKCKAVQNGSNSILLSDGNATVSVLQLAEPCISEVKSTQPARPAAILTPEPRSEHVANPPRTTERGDNSAEQPVPRTGRTTDAREDSVEQPALALENEFTWRENTPLFNNFLDCMNSNNAGKEILDFLANTCFWGEICCLDERGRYLPKPCSVGFKMEVMMETILEQRRWYVNDLARKHDPRVPARNPESVLNSLTFTDDDMKDLMNAWRLDVRSWMNPEQLEHYYSSRRWQQMGKSAFSVYLQHLSGCKFLLRRLVALPILSLHSAARPGFHPLVEQPEILLQLTREWNDHKNSPEHQEAIRRSQQSDQARLSLRLWNVQQQVKEAARLSRMVKDGTQHFFELSPDKQQMVEDYDCQQGTSKELKALLAQKAAAPRPYPGAGVILQMPSSA